MQRLCCGPLSCGCSVQSACLSEVPRQADNVAVLPEQNGRWTLSGRCTVFIREEQEGRTLGSKGHNC